MAQGEAVRAAYDAVASIYDQFTGNNNYELWFSELLPKLEELGLRKGALLDVACGTGKGIGPMLDRGWTVTACDISPGMIEQARESSLYGFVVARHLVGEQEAGAFGAFARCWKTKFGIEQDRAGVRRQNTTDGLFVFDELIAGNVGGGLAHRL